MEPFANITEVITFISLFIFAVAVIPWGFIKLFGDYE
jgi:hypothetical protein|tara:strand:+ start:320 stop:430 length:111 start_codon:yes stop_codon:yes gene_type:complete